MAASTRNPQGGPLLSMRGGAVPNAYHTLPMTHRSLAGGRPGARTATAGGSFAPSLSSSSFFTRHNPHPGRVRHIKGLLDVPICHVSDDPFQAAQPRPLMTPERRSIYQAQKAGSLMSQSAQHPIFPTNAYGVDTYDVFHTKGVPYRKVPMLPRWFEELKDISNRAGLEPSLALEQQQQMPAAPKASYSKVTGRMNEAPSRAMSRNGPSSRAGRTGGMGSRQGVFTGGINRQQPDNEALVMELLSQILQTDSISAIQGWLTNATDREKDLVSDMIKAAMASEQQAMAQQQPQGVKFDDFLENRQLGNQEQGQVDRLVLMQNNEANAAEAEVGEEQLQQMSMQTKLPDINQPQRSERLSDQVMLNGGKANNMGARFGGLATVEEAANDQDLVEYRNLDNNMLE